MRVLQLTSSYPPSAYGGDASQVAALHRAMNTEGSACVTITFQISEEAKSREENVITVSSAMDLRQAPDEIELLRINKLVIREAQKTTRPHVIHLHTTLFAVAGIMLSGMWKCPLIYTAHYPAQDYIADTVRAASILRAEALVIGKATRVICVSKWLQGELCQRYPEAAAKFTVIYNGVDTDLFFPESSRREYLLYAGRLTPQKGLEYLAPLVKQIQERIHLPLVVLGKGEEEEALRRSLDGCEVVHFGSVPADDMPGWMKRATALLLPSRWDPCPLVALEAMACGVPVVGSDIPGLNELVKDGETGLLVERTDAFAERASTRFLALCHDPVEYEGMSGRCRNRAVECFSLSMMTDQVASIYRDAVNEC